MEEEKGFTHAIVIGGSIGGMLAATVLAKYFKTVTVIEKDSHHDAHTLQQRKGVPQGGNGHLITTKGVKLLLEFFPELDDLLSKKGSDKFDILKNIHIFLGDWLPLFESKLYTYSVTRIYLEYCIRIIVEQNPNINFSYDTAVEEILTNPENTQIIGVITVDKNKNKNKLKANLIIDASGRHTLFPRWLADIGYPRIERTEVSVDIYYSTLIFYRPENITFNKKGIIVGTGYKHLTRTGGLFEVDKDENGRRWQVNLVARGAYAGNNPEDFIAFSHTLLQPDIYELINQAKPVADTFSFFKFDKSVIRHYEKARKLPKGFLVIGDAFAVVNPTYGHGVTNCALEAKLLDKLLASIPLDKIQEPYFKGIKKLIEPSWNIAVYHDFIFPDTKGSAPLFGKQLNAYSDLVNKIAITNQNITLALYKVINLELPSSTLLGKKVLPTVLKYLFHEFTSKLKFIYFKLRQRIFFNNDIIENLKKLPIFKDMETSELKKIARQSFYKFYDKDETIINKNEKIDSLQLVEKGVCVSYYYDDNWQKIILAEFKSGEYFGEQALSQSLNTYNMFIKALEPSVLIIIPRKIINQLFLNQQIEFNLQTDFNLESIKSLHSNILNVITNELLNQPIEEFSDQEIIFLKGQISNKVYILLSGQVNIFLEESKKSKKVTILHPIHLFGELGVLQNQLRAATAVAIGSVKLISIEADIFRKLHKLNPNLQALTSAMSHSYQIPHRGKVLVHAEHIFGLNTVDTLFELDDGRKVIASHVVEKNIFTMQTKDVEATNILIYKTDNIIHQEIGVKDGKVVSITSYENWNELGYACGLLLDNTSISPWQSSLFQGVGSLGSEHSIKNPNDIVCFCTQTPYKKILELIQNEASYESIVNQTGASSVCGSCKPNIMELLGKDGWTPVYIDKIIHLNDQIRSYQLKPFKKDIQAYQPGEHIVIQALINNNWVSRPYTLTSVYDDKDYYEITIKKELLGYFSKFMFEQSKNKLVLRVSAPQGNFHLPEENDKEIVFFAAGIGITPALAFSRSLKHKKNIKHFHIDYSAHGEDRFIYTDEYQDLKANLPNFSINMRNTEKQDRLQKDDIEQLIKKYPTAEFYICGPEKYQKMVYSILKFYHVKNIKFEEFTPIGREFEAHMS